jgi:hypothetical protein
MTYRLPLAILPAALALCALAHLTAVAVVHAAWDVGVPVDGLVAAIGVALDRLLHGDLGGAFEAVVRLVESTI